MSIDVPSPGDPILDTWGESVANAINHSHYAGAVPFVYPMGQLVVPSTAAAAINMAAAGGMIVMPFIVPAPFVYVGLQFIQANTSLERSCEAALYRDAASPTLALVAGTYAAKTFTPSAGSQETVSPATTVLLLPGLYWAALRCTHASNTLSCYYQSPSAWSGQKHSLQSTASAYGTVTTLNGAIDVSGMTKETSVYALRLIGEAMGLSGGW